MSINPADSPPLKATEYFIEREVRARGERMDRTGEFDADLLRQAADLGLPSLL